MKAETDAIVAHLGHYECGIIVRALSELRETDPDGPDLVPDRLMPLFAGHGNTTVIFTPDW